MRETISNLQAIENGATYDDVVKGHSRVDRLLLKLVQAVRVIDFLSPTLLLKIKSLQISR